MGFAIVMHLLTLPVEIDASFKKALPLLNTGYLDHAKTGGALDPARAAWTYVAAIAGDAAQFLALDRHSAPLIPSVCIAQGAARYARPGFSSRRKAELLI